MKNDNRIIVYDDRLIADIERKLSRPMPCRDKDINSRVYFNAKQKIYPDGNVEIKRYKFINAYRDDGWEEVKNKIEIEVDERIEKLDKEIEKKDTPKVEKTQEEVDKKIMENIQITRNKIYDIASSNLWNYFITLTYDSKVCDRYSFADTSKKVRRFMRNFGYRNKDKCPNFRYLIIHECHKDGAYHYHGLIYLDDDGTMSDSGKRTKKDQPIYNWDKWLNGWSTATKIGDLNAVTHYITKYVTKSIGDDYQKGQRRFFYSQNCQKPVIKRLMLSDDEFSSYDKTYESEVSYGYDTDMETLIKTRYGVDIKEILNDEKEN